MDIIDWSLILFFVGIISTVLVLFLFESKSIRVRVRETVNGTIIITDTKCRVVTDKDSQDLWLKNLPWCPKLYIPMMNYDEHGRAVNVGRNGKKYVECHKITDDQVIWIEDEGIAKGETRKTLDSFKGFSSTARTTVVNNKLIATQRYRNKLFSPENIVTFTALASLTIMVVCLILFYGEIVEPLNNAGNRADALLQKALDLEARLTEYDFYLRQGEIPQKIPSIEGNELIKGTEGIPPANR